MKSQMLMDMASDNDDVDQLMMECSNLSCARDVTKKVMVNFYGSNVKFAMPGCTSIVHCEVGISFPL